MPRTGGIYSAPAGTKGVPNTTIQSANYNAFVDDLSADANAPRPITAGGTGATNATTARANLGADNADNLTSGTVPDARLTGNYSNVGTFSTADLTVRAQGGEGGQINLIKGSAATVAGNVVIDQQGAGLRIFDVANPDTGLFINLVNNSITGFDGKVFWNSYNDGPGTGLDAGLFASQLPTYYTNIVARLGYQPFNRDGDQFQGNISWNVGTGEKTFTTTPGVYLFGNTASTGVYDSNGSGTVVWSYDVSSKTLSLSSQVTVNGFGLVLNNGQTYGVNISGAASNSANLGGVSAASYLKIADLRSTFAGIGVDEVGSLAVLSRISGGTFVPGDTSIASQLRYSNFDGSSLSGVAPSGNWMALSRVVGGTGLNSVGLWKRIA